MTQTFWILALTFGLIFIYKSKKENIEYLVNIIMIHKLIFRWRKKNNKKQSKINTIEYIIKDIINYKKWKYIVTLKNDQVCIYKLIGSLQKQKRK